MKKKLAVIVSVVALFTGCAGNSSDKDDSLADVKVTQYQQETVTTTEKQPEPTPTVTIPDSKKDEPSENNTGDFDKTKIPESEKTIRFCSRYDDDEFMSFVGFLNESERMLEQTVLEQLGVGYIHLNSDKEVFRKVKKEAGFDFEGTTVRKVDGNAIEGFTNNETGDILYLEYAEVAKTVTRMGGDYPNHVITAICIDKDNVKDLNDYHFGRSDKVDEEDKVYHLGDKRETVEKIMGKGYDYGNYSFYQNTITNGEPEHYYQIVEYGDDTVQRVYFLHKEL